MKKIDTKEKSIVKRFNKLVENAAYCDASKINDLKDIKEFAKGVIEHILSNKQINPLKTKKYSEVPQRSYLDNGYRCPVCASNCEEGDCQLSYG